MLASGALSYDDQFAELEAVAARHGLDYRPFVEPLRIFVGSEYNQQLAVQVLAHTIRKHASVPVRITEMIDLPYRVPKDPNNRPRTTFSFYRLMIPELAGFRGKALYIDSDMQVFGDIAELWDVEMGDAKVLCTFQPEPPEAWKDNSWFHPGRQMSVMMLDCSRLPWKMDEIVDGLDEGRFDYRQLMFELCLVEPDEIEDRLPPEWNHLEHYEPGESRLVHYTVVPTQPWKVETNPLNDLWMGAYEEAVAAGAVSPALVRELVEAGEVKPSLLEALSKAPEAAAAPPRSAAERELQEARRRLDEVSWSLDSLRRSRTLKVGRAAIAPLHQARVALLKRRHRTAARSS
jgi:hypothetical protein